MFNLTLCIMVLDVGLVRGLLTMDPNALTVGPFADGSADTATICTCNIVPLPNKYATLFLANAGGVTGHVSPLTISLTPSYP